MHGRLGEGRTVEAFGVAIVLLWIPLTSWWGSGCSFYVRQEFCSDHLDPADVRRFMHMFVGANLFAIKIRSIKEIQCAVRRCCKRWRQPVFLPFQLPLFLKVAESPIIQLPLFSKLVESPEISRLCVDFLRGKLYIETFIREGTDKNWLLLCSLSRSLSLWLQWHPTILNTPTMPYGTLSGFRWADGWIFMEPRGLSKCRKECFLYGSLDMRLRHIHV